MRYSLLMPAVPPSAAIEERYAVEQCELLIRKSAAPVETLHYPPWASCADLASEIEAEWSVVVTDPQIVTPPDFAPTLLEAAATRADVAAAIPGVSGAANRAQSNETPPAYQTLRQFEEIATAFAARADASEVVRWDSSNPSVFACRTQMLEEIRQPTHLALAKRDVAIVRRLLVHRYAPLRSASRNDLLQRVPASARNILEFGCGEGVLGAALKSRQRCRVVGIEIDAAAANIAGRRIDAVYRGDAQKLIDTIDENFDFIIGGDIVEHLIDPWTFLGALRNVAAPGCGLLLSIPNFAAWPILADLLRGRFDYVYAGLACAGHLRFFTKKSIEDIITMSGWKVENIEPQEPFVTPELDDFESRLRRGGFDIPREELQALGYYVTARV